MERSDDFLAEFHVQSVLCWLLQRDDEDVSFSLEREIHVRHADGFAQQLASMSTDIIGIWKGSR